MRSPTPSISVREVEGGLLLADAEPDAISLAALSCGVALRELRPADDGNSLEHLFFQLTEDRGGAMSDRRPPLSRLVAVELRKTVNTRSGFWVIVGIAWLIVVFALVNGLAHGGREATYTHVFHDALQPSAYLLPILGVLLSAPSGRSAPR